MNNKEKFIYTTLATLFLAGCASVSEAQPTVAYADQIPVTHTYTPTLFIPEIINTLTPEPFVSTEVPTKQIEPYKLFGIDFSNSEKRNKY